MVVSGCGGGAPFPCSSFWHSPKAKLAAHEMQCGDTGGWAKKYFNMCARPLAACGGMPLLMASASMRTSLGGMSFSWAVQFA